MDYQLRVIRQTGSPEKLNLVASSENEARSHAEKQGYIVLSIRSETSLFQFNKEKLMGIIVAVLYALLISYCIYRFDLLRPSNINWEVAAGYFFLKCLVGIGLGIFYLKYYEKII